MSDAVTHRSPLEACHLELGATLIEFAGWSMPVRYTSDLAEHEAVRTGVGLFDLSHMGEIRVQGAGAADALDFALVGRASRIDVGRAKYTMACTEQGGIIDDLIVYRLGPEDFLIVANAGNAQVVVAELRSRCAGFDCQVIDESASTALIAVQGPRAIEVVEGLLEPEDAREVSALRYYSIAGATVGGIPVRIARTGYTGEDGFEFFCPVDDAVRIWRTILESGAASGVAPCGLASRDTLRLEAGMPLYGHELSLERGPFEAGLGRVVHLGTPEDPRSGFVGREALTAAKARVEAWRDDPGSAPEAARLLVGLVGDGMRAARGGYPVLGPEGVIGEVTSGAPSPTLRRAVAMAYIHPRHTVVGSRVEVDVRGRNEAMAVVALPFYTKNH